MVSIPEDTNLRIKVRVVPVIWIGSKSLWRWHINTIIDFSDIHPVFLLKTTFRGLDSVSVLR
jgi:hypothetical protein